jgi:hypothetical protein
LYQQVSDGHVVREDLQGLNERGFGSRPFAGAGNGVGKFEDPAVGRSDEENVVDFAVDASNAGIDGDDRQAFAEAGFDEDGAGVGAWDRPGGDFGKLFFSVETKISKRVCPCQDFSLATLIFACKAKRHQ